MAVYFPTSNGLRTTLVVQVQESVGCVSPVADDRLRTKWPLIETFGVLVQLDPN